MTKAEKENTIHCLKVMIDEEVCEECNLYGTTGTDHCEADCVRSAIKALALEPCEDAISREKAKQFLYERLDRLNDDELYDIFSKIIDDMYNELPSATPQEPRKGHWDIKDNMWWVCSACGCQTRLMKKYNVPRFCPACGADMRG